MERKSTFGLRLDQMAGLFAMSSGEPDSAVAERTDIALANVLRQGLAGDEPDRSLLLETLVMMMDRQGYDVAKLGDRSLGDVLLNPQSDLGLLRTIKTCSKTLSSSLDSKTETALARTLYFASLASALVHHDAKITELSYKTLAESFAMLIEKEWMEQELVGLFSQARRICESRSDEV